jgi:hypothetical protein
MIHTLQQMKIWKNHHACRSISLRKQGFSCMFNAFSISGYYFMGMRAPKMFHDQPVELCMLKVAA